MKKFLTKFMKEEDGATIIEYVIMLSIVAGIVFFAFPSLRSNVANWFGDMINNVGGGLKTENLDNTKLCQTGETWNETTSTCE